MARSGPRLWQPSSLVGHAWRLLVAVLLLTGGIIMLLPVIWGALSSLKPAAEILRIPMEWLPRAIATENYTHPLAQRDFVRYFGNSMIVATATTIIQVVFCSMAGFGLAKYLFWGRNALFILILSTLMIPPVAILVPLYLLVQQLGWLNSYIGLILPFSISGFGIFLMRQYIAGIPDDYIEAARIDGAGEFRIFWQIVFPMSRPGVGALALLAFIYAWNDFLWPLVAVTRREYYTVMVGIAMFQSDYQTEYGQLLAMATLSSLPLILVFLLMQRRFIESVNLTGIKG